MLSGEGLRQEAQFFAALDSLGATGSSELLEGACTVRLDCVFGNEQLPGNLAITAAAGDQGENFELTYRDTEGLLVRSIGSERSGSLRRDSHFPHHNRFADNFATPRDTQAEPYAEDREEDGYNRGIDLDRVLDDDEAVFGVLEDGDEETADETEDEGVTLHYGSEGV
jgi:hypothetical protein